MSRPAAPYSGYERKAVRILISMPDDLMREVEAAVESRGETRSEYLRRLVAEDMERLERETQLG
jgi:metal-responsive CopG/Arc/MetJ family transcriptional regulator